MKGDLSCDEFARHFEAKQIAKETKIYQTSAKKRNFEAHDVSFGTPMKNTHLTQASTKLKQQTLLSEVRSTEFQVGSSKVIETLESIAKQ